MNRYSNTETTDLWKAWSQASGQPVEKLMASWTEQMGYPLVTVKSCSGTEVELEQTWFLADGSEVKKEEEKTWTIPIIFQDAKPVLMEGKTQKFSIPKSDFLLINAGREVPVRVLYTDELYSKLATAIQKGQLGVSDRAGLVLDSFALAKAGKLGADKVFQLLASFKNERNYIVWDAISQVLNGFNAMLMVGVSDSVYASFKSFVSKLIADAAKEIGWQQKESDGHLDGLLREDLINLQAKFSQDPEAIQEAKKRFEAFLAGDSACLPDDIKEPVFRMVLQSGGEKEYKAVREIHSKAETNIERKHVYVTIGSAASAALKKDVLQWVISGDIKIQDFFYPLNSVAASSKEAVEFTWEFYKANFEKIWGMCKTASPSLMDAMIAGSARGFCTSEKAAEVEQRLGDDPTETLWVRGDWIDSRGFLYRSSIKFSFCGFALLARKTDRCFSDGFWVVVLWFLMRFLYFHWCPMTFCCRLSIVESQPKEHRPHVWAKNAQVTKVIHLGQDTLAT
ncbi:unnamed protein product [Effrenium voratum]|uniref:ERAP1-like C-terminal domain-containing protein n=1 Tax=Effrenium voratum TaxID=2562239 RepID=A0AA36ITF4_9DINO|nr:unnamed protein product [Effrenium voratum]